ncbi:toll-like receptor 4 [Biomphalaria glabrata]
MLICFWTLDSSQNTNGSKLNFEPFKEDINSEIIQTDLQNYVDLMDYLPVSVMFLDLSFNQILTIVNCSFCNYTDLTELNLSNNIIDLLTIETFSRLFKLKRLNLAGNKLNYVMSTFPEGVFSDLISLTTLFLHYNAKDCESSCSYPDSTLSELTQLRTLSLDGISPFILGPKFKDLINLRNLTFSMEICNIDALTGTTFLNVGQITALNLTNCNILGLKVSNNTFTPLVHLNSLDVSNNNKLRVKHLFRVLRSIQTYNITELKFNYVEPFYSTSIIIDDTILEGLPRSLKILEGKGNHSRWSFTKVSYKSHFTSLTKLMLGYNKLEPYFRLMESNIRPFSKLNKLQTLDLSDNAITKMHADIFAGLTNLRILYFEMNSMWIFHLNIGHMMNLQ